ncbi:MAG TPA: Gfo/Idh/MocA family oxidoreductase [Kiritimatiellia bacterium]|nr:Gfo/Idh/MocA family oxidoreductase [Kiritimatiellia bacterium]
MIRIAIVGTGGMANAHAGAYKRIRGCRVVAGVDVDRARAQAFCEKHGIPNVYTSVNDLLKECDFDAASVVTPDSFHVPCALPLVKAGKHVLCEKPIAPTAPEGRKLVEAAAKSGVINMINFSYRNNAVLHAAHDLVAKGALGRIMHFEARYLQSWLSSKVWGDWRTTPAWLWRCSTGHGSKGALGDIGVHIVDLATYVAADSIAKLDARLKTFDKAPGNRIGEYALDANDSAYLRAELRGGGIGTIATTRWATGHRNSLAISVHGEKGALRFDLDRSGTEMEVCLGKDVDRAEWKRRVCRKTPNLYQRFIRAIRTGRNDDSDFRRGWEVQRVLDACFVADKKHSPVTIR